MVQTQKLSKVHELGEWDRSLVFQDPEKAGLWLIRLFSTKSQIKQDPVFAGPWKTKGRATSSQIDLFAGGQPATTSALRGAWRFSPPAAPGRRSRWPRTPRSWPSPSDTSGWEFQPLDWLLGMVAKSISHHLETLVETMGLIIPPGSLRWWVWGR